MEEQTSSQTPKLNITALVVDGDEVSQLLHKALLKRFGIQSTDIDIARNGREAVDLHCSGKRFDLILMDLDMHVMNGIEATRKLREMGIESTIAVVSARSMDDMVRKFLMAGVDVYQEKPLTIAKLDSIMQKVSHKG